MLLLGSAWVVVGAPAEAQFNPGGRHKPKPKVSTPARPGSAPQPPRPATTPANAEPSSSALIARYTAIVLKQPDAQFPIKRLSELYRQRDGTLDRLFAEFEQRARSNEPEAFSALVALAGIFRQAGSAPEAQATYEQASLKRPQDPMPRLALAELFKEQGETARASQAYSEALKFLSDAGQRELTLRTLLTLCLDLEDYESAARHHRLLVKLGRGSFFVEAELGRELFARGKYERAVEENRRVVRVVAGDNRVLLPALRDLGRALAKASKNEEALVELRRAVSIAGQSGILTEIYQTIADIYRGQNRLPELMQELEARSVNDFDRRRLLAELYEETGQLAKAQKTYSRLATQRPRDVALHLKLIGLRELQGDLKGTISEYEKLIAAEPRNPDFVFRMAEALLQQGDRVRALAELQKLEQRAQGDEEVLATLVGFYERLGDPTRATQILERITTGAGGDPRHLLELGNRYWDADDKNKAHKTWKQVEHVGPDRAANLLLLGDVYLQHGLTLDALSAYREARKLKPSDRPVERAYALSLERAGAQATEAQRRRYYEEAGEIWFALLKQGSTDRHAAREARQHIVTLWSLNRSLAGRPAALRLQLERKPPDLESGRLLAEAWLKLGQPEQAEATLRKLVELAPGDVESWANLERTLVKLGRFKQAIAALEQLVILDPNNAKQFYQRMAEHSAALYRDADALRFAARALELNPDDADGHRRLGEMYRKRNLPEKAIQAFRKAISKNDRLFPVYFDLAELLLNQGHSAEADRLVRRVMRSAVDDELVARAVRISSHINLSLGTLRDLEHELFQVSLGHPNRPLYRELLIEIYGTLAFPLISGARSLDPEVRATSRRELELIGERAIKPLLDALNDPQGKQRQIAIELLSYIQNKGAGPALITFAQGDADVNLRTRALLAAGNLRDPSLLSRFKDVLYPHGKANIFETDPVSVAATFALATLSDPRAAPILVGLLKSEAPSIQALAALGLGSLKYRAATPLLIALCRSSLASPLVRAAAARAIAQIGDPAAVPVLQELVWSSDARVRQNALVALASLSKDTDPGTLASALLDPDPKTREAAKLGSLVATTGKSVWPQGLPTPQGARVDVGVLLELNRGTVTFSNPELAAAFIWQAPLLRQVAQSYTQASIEGARTVAASIGGTRENPIFLPLLETTDGLPPGLALQVLSYSRELVSALLEPFAALMSHPSADLRQIALEFVGRHADDATISPVIRALTDPSEAVALAAVAVIAERKTRAAAGELEQLLAHSPSWTLRLRAAETLRLLGAPAGGAGMNALRLAARDDRYALVRRACLESLAVLDPEGSFALFGRIARTDADQEVRKAAKSLLQAH